MKTPSKSTYISTTDFLVSGEKFELLFDEKTGILETSPKPDNHGFSNYYKSEAYLSHTDSGKGIMAVLYQWVKKLAIKMKMDLILKMSKTPGSLLDIGAGTGDFLRGAGARGWCVSGVEPNENARKRAEEKGILLSQSLDDFFGQTFDVITLWHVLEHLPDLQNAVQKIDKLLKPSGILIVAVPNYKAYDARHYKEFWAGFDVPRHLWHFSRKSMDTLFPKNLKLQKTKPMYFDAFYVSLLSEKYKTGNPFSLKGLGIGLCSNLRALRSKEFSSLIYCYKKENIDLERI